MEKLNELVSLAKKATQGKWHAFVSNGGGEGTFSIHTPDDSRKGDVINWPGFDTAGCSKSQKKANARYIAAANPETILAIAESFRDLEQEVQKNLDGALAWQQRAEAAEAKLAELTKQEPYGYVHNLVDPPLGSGVAASIFKKENRHYGRPVFTRPAPAVDLADLVPDDTKRMEWLVSKVVNVREPLHGDEKYVSNLREQIDAAILRNIDGAKK